MKEGLKEKTIWTGEHLGVLFQIVNWDGRWNYYLILRLDRIPEKSVSDSYWLKRKKSSLSGNHVLYGYYDHPILPNLDWHGGITWYSKESGFDGDPKTIKVGCDYSHLWDEGHEYILEDIIPEVERTIEKFRELVPGYKYWCSGNGNLYDLSEGEYENGRFVSNEWKKNNPHRNLYEGIK